MSKKKIPKPKKQNRLPISQHAISYDELKARIAFQWCCDNKFLLSGWDSRQLNKLIYCFKRMEKTTWKDIKRDPKFNYKTIDHLKTSLPKNLPQDFVKLKSIEVGEVERIYGYRLQSTFNIVFFDANHKVCAM